MADEGRGTPGVIQGGSEFGCVSSAFRLRLQLPSIWHPEIMNEDHRESALAYRAELVTRGRTIEIVDGW